MCLWMGSPFHDWNDYNGVAFLIVLPEWGRKFPDFGVGKDSKWEDSRFKKIRNLLFKLALTELHSAA